MASAVAVLALPVKAAVMMLAMKLPLASLATMALAVLALVAVVAELDTLPAVLIVANIAFVIVLLGRVNVLPLLMISELPLAQVIFLPLGTPRLLSMDKSAERFRSTAAVWP